MHLDGGVLVRLAGFLAAAGDLDVAGQPDPELDGVTAVTAGGLLAAQLRIAGRLEHLVQRRGVVAAVVQGTGRCRVRLGELR